jgi:glyoxylase-like metal-dependent hydrolase (beta-lactamase superfamily II)
VPAAVKSFSIGDFRCHAIDDGVSTYATASFLFASAPEPLREKMLREAGEDPDAIRCSNTCLLLETDGTRILIDTGSGSLAGVRAGRENLGRLYAGLEAAGVAPQEIDIVILTHLHSDHAWGCLGPDGRGPLFESARHVIARTEWETMHPSVAEDLNRLESLVDLAEPDAEVVPGVRLRPAPGHSLGHCAVHVTSDGQELLCVGDAVAHWINLEHPEWTMGHEDEPALAEATRRRLLDQAVADGMLVHAYHMPFPSLGRIHREGAGYAWEPASMAG